jgi:hypothetical protein
MVSCMLLQKFPGSEAYYNSNHVITKIGIHYYDWDGVVAKTDDFLEFNKFGDNWIVNHYNAIMDNNRSSQLSCKD